MAAKILSILAGVLACELALVDTVAAFIFAAVLCVLGTLYRRPMRAYVGYVLAGVLFASAHIVWISIHQFPAKHNGELYWVEGSVKRLMATPVDASAPVFFLLGGVDAETYAGRKLALQNLRLSSFGELKPQRHDVCMFFTRLKAPIGTSNPGGGNRETRYFIQRISALGYVVEHPLNRCISKQDEGAIARVRSAVLTSLAASDLKPSSKAIVRSLSVGDRDALSDEQWSVFQLTGTAHLLAISGLHVGLVAALSFWVARSFLLLFVSRWGSTSIYRSALLISLGVATCYAAIAGFSLPTQRAAIVVLVSTLALLRCRPYFPSEALLVAALGVVVVNPFAMLSLGFWMSFGAVSILILIRALRPFESWTLSTLRTHCYLSLGSLPLVMTMNDMLPVSSPLANFFAVPVMCFTIVPLVLLGVFLALCGSQWYEGSWQAAAFIWEYLWPALQWLSIHSPAFELPKTLSVLQLVLMLAGMIGLLIPLIPRRWLFVSVCFVQILFPASKPLKHAEWRLTTLDVGQGLSVIIETANHVVVYDTGPAAGTYNAGESIVIPALKSLGHRTVDRVVISHADNDHVGGLIALRGSLGASQRAVISADPSALSIPAMSCKAGQHWQWDGVVFSMLAPFERATGSKNDLSCVLKLESFYGTALLPGDIEASTETLLVNSYPDGLRTDILLAPHHGSNTSSTPAFVEAVAPAFVVFAAGYENRFGFPHRAVRERYSAIGAQSFVTGHSGAISFDIKEAGIRVSTKRARALPE